MMKKRNSLNLVMLVISSILQCIFFRFFSDPGAPFAFVTGIRRYESLSCCAICLPVFFLVLLFSDYYSFYMENYGRLLLVRRCGRDSVVIRLFLKMGLVLLLLVLLQMGINFLFFPDFLIRHWRLVVRCGIVCYGILYSVISMEFLLCTCFGEQIVCAVVNLYFLVGCFIHTMPKQQVIKKIFYTGKVVNLKKLCEKMNTCAVVMEILVLLCFSLLLCWFSIIRCRKKDFF